MQSMHFRNLCLSVSVCLSLFIFAFVTSQNVYVKSATFVCPQYRHSIGLFHKFDIGDTSCNKFDRCVDFEKVYSTMENVSVSWKFNASYQGLMDVLIINKAFQTDVYYLHNKYGSSTSLHLLTSTEVWANSFRNSSGIFQEVGINCSNVNSLVLLLSNETIKLSCDVGVPPTGKMSSTSNMFKQFKCNEKDDTVQLLQNKRLKLSFGHVQYLPYVSFKVDLKTNKKIFAGVMYEVAVEMAKLFGFTFDTLVPPDNVYGDLINGSWTGVFGMLLRKEVDLFIAPVAITDMTNNIVDFTTPFSFEPSGILIRMPVESLSMWKMIFIFNYFVWITVGACFIGTIVIIYILTNVPIYKNINIKHRTVTEIALYVFRHITTQEGIIAVKQWSNRMFQIGWRIFVFLLVASYSGNLTAVLSTNRIRLPFSDIQGLAESVAMNEYKICVSAGNAMHRTILTSETPDYKIFRKFLSENKQYADTIPNCVVKMSADPTVAIIGETSFLKQIQNKFCGEYETILLDYRFFPVYLSIALPKHSPLTPIFSNVISDMVESGLMDVWKSKYSVKTICTDKPGLGVSASSKSVTFQSIGGIFIIFAVGIIFGISIFLLEFFERK